MEQHHYRIFYCALTDKYINMPVEREQWKTRLGFLFASVGAAIGIGNIWRFNYILYENTGTFIVPYIVAIIVLGIPLFVSEVWSGFWSRGSPPLVYKKIKKFLEPIGWWTLINTFIISIYYAAIVGWFFSYTIFSITSFPTSPQSFFNNFLSSNVPAIAGALTWIISIIILSLGVKKGVENFSLAGVSLLWILLFILLVRVTTLPNAGEGIVKYLTVDWNNLWNWKIWITAFGQVAFSLSLAVGIMQTFGSYLSKKSEIVPNTYTTVFADTSFSILSAIVIFSVLGISGFRPEEGMSLVFITFPLAATHLPGKILFSFIFFFTLSIAGITSCIASLETVVAGITDRFKIKRKLAVLLVGIPSIFVTALVANNIGIIKFLDNIASTISLPIIALIECIIFGWLIGANRIRETINSTSRLKLNRLFDIGLKFVSPTILLILIALSSKFVTSLEMKVLLLIFGLSVFLTLSALLSIFRKVEEFLKNI